MLCGAPGSGTDAPRAFAMCAPTIFPLTDAVYALFAHEIGA